jgi:2-iminobutanoate/2-iminopropanoate deaminase
MNVKRNPSGIAPPVGRYTHSIEAPANARLLAISGQVGNGPDGKTPSDFAAQAENCWRNLSAILADAGMGMGDVIKVNTYLTRASDIAAYRAVRDRMIGDARPAATLVVISALAAPEFLIEIEAWAAKA